MNNNICGTCQHYQSEVCPIYDHNLPFEVCPNHWSKRKNKQTLFERITQSPEVLAEKLVYYDCDGYWHSTIVFCRMFPDCFEDFNTEAEAIAATLAKLKEICNE
jgi:hypothetical protein